MSKLQTILADVEMVGADDGGSVSAKSLAKADARRLADELLAAGYEASWAPDNDDISQAWLYVHE